jgi:peptidoglycan/LPS O-acetylase OafA/YrhL
MVSTSWKLGDKSLKSTSPRHFFKKKMLNKKNIKSNCFIHNTVTSHGRNSISQKKYFTEINLVRGVAILAIVAIHTTGYFTTIKGSSALSVPLFSLNYFFGLFAVPLFIFISGFVLATNYNEKINIRQFYIKRFKSVLIPYLVFSFIAFAIFSTWYGQISLSDFVIYLVLFDNVSYYFFIGLIVTLYLLFPIIIKGYLYLEKRNLARWFVICAFVGQVAYELFYLYIWAPMTVTGSYIWIIQREVFITVIFFFILGIYFSRNYENIINYLNWKTVASTFILSLILGILSVELWLPPLRSMFNHVTDVSATGVILSPIFCSVFFVALIGILLKVKTNVILNSLGENSYIIYLSHAFFQLWIAQSLIVPASDWSFYILLYVGIIAGSWSVAILWNKSLAIFCLIKNYLKSKRIESI